MSSRSSAAHRSACFSDVGSMSEKHIGLTSKTDVGPTRIIEVSPTSVTRQVTHQCPTSDRGHAAHRLLINPVCFSDVGPMSEKHIVLTSETEVGPMSEKHIGLTSEKHAGSMQGC